MRRGLGVLAGVLLLAGCGSSAGTGMHHYVFHDSSSSVRLDTPALRAQKARAGIAGCPRLPHMRPRGGGLPDATLPCLGGGPSVDLASLRGRPTLLNLWAQYCGPCRQESPVIQQFHRRAGNHVRVLGIDFADQLPSRAIAFAAEYHLTYPQLADPDAVLKAPLRATGIPITLFVRADGRIAFTHYGPMTSLTQLKSLVRRHLGVRT
jgi:cytochrome c biogenesis protein CcmG/thiol:disulfide interchange protein DsbE